MLRFGVVTLFPEMFTPFCAVGITGRASARGLLELSTFDPREFSAEPHRRVDERPYGGGPGMVMTVEPLRAAVRAARRVLGEATRVAYLSPQGRRLDQAAVERLARRPALVLVCGRYEGVDERFIEADVDEEWSIGDYVLSGGEPAAMVLIDALARLLPGALGHPDSAVQDSFSGGLLDYPHYTRPRELAGVAVPPVLLSGDHERIRRWRLKQALGRTWERRPEMLRGRDLDSEQRELLEEYLSENGACPPDLESEP